MLPLHYFQLPHADTSPPHLVYVSLCPSSRLHLPDMSSSQSNSFSHSHGCSALLEVGRLIFQFRFYSPKPYFFPMCLGGCVSTKQRLALLFGGEVQGVFLLQITTHIWGLTMLTVSTVTKELHLHFPLFSAQTYQH